MAKKTKQPATPKPDGEVDHVAKRMPAAQRREQLLDCAALLFAEVGYARATTAGLADKAGVTEPIIYRHFKSKKELFVALIERTAQRTLSHWRAQLAGGDRDPTERLRRIIGDNPMVSDSGKLPYRVFLQAITEVNDPEIHKAVNRHMRDLQAFLTAEIRHAQEDRKMTKVFSAELLAWTMLYIGLGYGVLSAMGVEGHGEDPHGGHVQQLLERVMLGKRDDND